MSYNITLKPINEEHKIIMVSNSKGEAIKKAITDGARFIEIEDRMLNTSTILEVEHIKEPVRVSREFQLKEGEIKSMDREKWVKFSDAMKIKYPFLKINKNK